MCQCKSYYVMYVIRPVLDDCRVWCSGNATKALPVSVQHHALASSTRLVKTHKINYLYEVILFIFWRLAKWGERDVCVYVFIHPVCSVRISYVVMKLFVLGFRCVCVWKDCPHDRTYFGSILSIFIFPLLF